MRGHFSVAVSATLVMQMIALLLLAMLRNPDTLPTGQPPGQAVAVEGRWDIESPEPQRLMSLRRWKSPELHESFAELVPPRLLPARAPQLDWSLVYGLGYRAAHTVGTLWDSEAIAMAPGFAPLPTADFSVRLFTDRAHLRPGETIQWHVAIRNMSSHEQILIWNYGNYNAFFAKGLRIESADGEPAWTPPPPTGPRIVCGFGERLHYTEIPAGQQRTLTTELHFNPPELGWVKNDPPKLPPLPQISPHYEFPKPWPTQSVAMSPVHRFAIELQVNGQKLSPQHRAYLKISPDAKIWTGRLRSNVVTLRIFPPLDAE